MKIAKATKRPLFIISCVFSYQLTLEPSGHKKISLSRRKNQKEDFEDLVSKMITEEDILQSIPNLYNLSWWPKDDFDVIKSIKDVKNS